MIDITNSGECKKTWGTKKVNGCPAWIKHSNETFKRLYTGGKKSAQDYINKTKI